MSSTFVQMAGGIGRKVLTVTTLGIIGIGVGIGCVLLPPAAPFGVIGLAVALLLWVMPDLKSVPERWARRMVPVVVFVYTCVPVYYAIILPGLPWISLRRATLFAWLVPFVIAAAGSNRCRRRVVDILRASPLLSFCTLAFMAVTLLTLPTAAYLSQSIIYVGNSFLLYFAPMFGVILLVSERDQIFGIYRAAAYGMVANLAVGMIEYKLQRPFLIYLLPSYMRQQIFAANSILEGNLLQGMGDRNGFYRVSSTFTTALSWGEICAIILPLCLHFFAYGKSGREKTFGLAAALASLASISLSASRGAYVGAISALVAYSISWSLRSTVNNKAGLAGKISLTLYSMLAVATCLAVLFVGRIHRIVLGGGAAQLSTDSRYVEWALAKPKILARPIQGYGGGSAGEVIHYISLGGAYTVDGYYMNLLVDYGVIGCVLFFAIYLIAIFSCFRLYLTSSSQLGSIGNGLGASMIAFIVYRITLSQNDSLTFSFMLIGLTMIYAYAMRQQHTKEHQSLLRRSATFMEQN